MCLLSCAINSKSTQVTRGYPGRLIVHAARRGRTSLFLSWHVGLLLASIKSHIFLDALLHHCYILYGLSYYSFLCPSSTPAFKSSTTSTVAGYHARAEFSPFFDSRCYEYSWGGTKSAQLTDCDSKDAACQCMFYIDGNCQTEVPQTPQITVTKELEDTTGSGKRARV
jgi:hypothetical protein